MLVESGEVKNKLAIVEALDWDNTMLSNVIAGRRNVPPDIYKKFTEIYNIEIEDPGGTAIENQIEILASYRVILSVLAEIQSSLMEEKMLPTQLHNIYRKMVRDEVEQVRDELRMKS